MDVMMKAMKVDGLRNGGKKLLPACRCANAYGSHDDVDKANPRIRRVVAAKCATRLCLPNMYPLFDHIGRSIHLLIAVSFQQENS